MKRLITVLIVIKLADLAKVANHTNANPAQKEDSCIMDTVIPNVQLATTVIVLITDAKNVTLHAILAQDLPIATAIHAAQDVC
jgi:hypothetical protein